MCKLFYISSQMSGENRASHGVSSVNAFNFSPSIHYCGAVGREVTKHY